MWLGLALLTVAGLILTLQALAAVYSGISLPTAFPHLKEEIAAFASLALGYMGLYLEERLFQRRRLMKALAVNTVLFTFLFTTMFFGLRLTTLAPILTFVSGVAVRTLQQTVLRSAWFLGTAAPIAAACLSAGPLLSVNTRSPLWTTALIRWTGLTVACYFLTLLARAHQRKTPGGHWN